MLAWYARDTLSPPEVTTKVDERLPLDDEDMAVSQTTTAVHRDMTKVALEHHRAGRLVEAEQMYRQLLADDPDNADCLHLLGMVAHQTGRHDLAVELIRKAIALHSMAASYHSNLGNVLQAQGSLHEAGACYQQALTLKPNQAEVWVNMGHILKAQGELDSGLACYRRALEIKPGLAEARVAESMALLLGGDYSAGWRNFELRWQTQDYDTLLRTYSQPLWKGEPLTSGGLLIWGEQGVGDEVMFAGLIPDVRSSGNRLILDCDARLQPLFARSFPEVEVVSGYEPHLYPELRIAAHLPSGSLPGLFRTDHEAFAATTSTYLVADPVATERFRRKSDDGRPRVGLAWQTRNKKSGGSRSIDLALLAPLFSRSDIQWVSLQYGDHDALENQASTAGATLLIDRAVDQLSDIDNFAAQISAMDLVVTIDNSTAHLAAALGVPTWVLLPFAPDWRWLLGRDDSPWYPTMRLFRQPLSGDWPSVVEQVQAALATTFHRP